MSWVSLNLLDYSAIVLSLFLLSYLTSTIRQKNTHTLPPGPPGYPILGHLKMPAEPAWAAYRDWGMQYNSDVIRLNVVGINIIVLNSFKACVDLLDRRSNIYSDRPLSWMTMVRELCGLSWSLGLQPYGSEWRDGRKALQREMSVSAIKKYRGVEVNEVHKLLNRLLREPEKFWDHTHQMVSGQLIRVAYGIEVYDRNNPYVLNAEHAMEAVDATLNPGAYLVDLLPILKYIPEWVPGAGFQREARIWRKAVTDTLEMPWAYSKAQMESDPDSTPLSAAKSLTESMINPSKNPDYTERVVKSALGVMYLAGSDTTLTALRSFFIASVLYPDVFRRAQQYVDEVCKARLPEFSDYDSLPYIHAIARECLRWRPVVPLNLPHRCMADDMYRGYFISKSSIVIANIHAMLHDPEVYNRPNEFDPDRFFKGRSSNGLTPELDPDVLSPMDVTFGFGRRICPGRHLAYESLWMTIASFVAVFDIGKAKDTQGNEIIPSDEYEIGSLSHPKPFMCKIVPRSPHHESLIRDCMDSEMM